MSLIQQLQNFDLDLTKLHELTERDFIRIEKKFKAEIKLNDSLDMNDLEQIIYVLKNQQQEMIWLMKDELSLLKKVLTNPKKFIVKKGVITINSAIDRMAFGLFLETYFIKELHQYVDKCIQNDFYNALHSLLKFQALLSPQILNEIQQKLENKLNYAVECIAIGASDISRKVSYCTNPYFFRVLSQLGSGQYESEVNDLLNITINKLSKKALHWGIVFAMGSFAAQSENLKDTLRSNKSIAIQRGVSETKVNSITGRPTGGVAKTGDPIGVNSEEKGSNKGCYTIFFAIVIIIGIIFSIRECQRKNRISNNFTEERWVPSFESDPDQYGEAGSSLEEYKKTLPQSILNQFEKMDEPTDLSREASTFEETINYLHSKEAVIIEVRDIPFEIDATGLMAGSGYHGQNTNIQLVNLLGVRLVLQSRTAFDKRYHVIEPNATITLTNRLLGLNFYAGADPVLVDYFDENGEEQTHFKFNKVTEQQLAEFNNSHSITQNFDEDEQYEILVFYNKGEVIIQITQQ